MLNNNKKGKPEHSRSRIDCENTLEKHSLPGFGYARKASYGFPYSDSPELIGPLSQKEPLFYPLILLLS